jgi:hypothetical protein
MGGMIKDSSALSIIVQLNARFEAGDAIEEMVALQKEFQIFSPMHNLRHSFAVLNIVPGEWSERKRWYSFLEFLKGYESDLKEVSGHDRIVKAFKDNLDSKNPLPVFIATHSAKDDKRVRVTQGRPIVFSIHEHIIISIPTTPGREARQEAAQAAKKRRTKPTAKK